MAHLLAASFANEAAAEAALSHLLRRFGGHHEEIRVSPLGRASDPTGPGAVLAGRFEDDVLDAVRAAVEAAGGSIIVIRDWTGGEGER
jgi:hypothetical protein